MPLFSCSHFKLRRAQPRDAHFRASGDSRAAEEAFEEVKVKLGQVTSVFRDGEWINDLPQHKSDAEQEVTRIRAEKAKLEEQNNLLRVKNELLLDTVVVQKSKIGQLEKENGSLREIFNRSKTRFQEPGGI